MNIPIFRAKKISQEKIKELFEYKEGELRYRIARGNRAAGQTAGTVDKSGYDMITMEGKRYLTHRLIYAYFNGDIEDTLKIDHINGNKLNNHIDNLRKVTVQENGFNSNCNGYSYNKKENKYKVKIVVDGKAIHLGCFDNKEDARSSYLKGKEKYHIIKDRQC